MFLPDKFRTTAFNGLTRGVVALTTLLALVSPACAQIGSDRYSAIVVEVASGAVLSAASPDELRYPASLTKIMTAYMLFEALRDRRLSLDQPVPISAHAASQQPSKLGLVPGTYITVEQALLGLTIKSANDAAAALGELMGGDEGQFAQMMTVRARGLGMVRTTFRNASGLPNWDQVTTARDLALLARHLVQDFPTYYSYFSKPGFLWHGHMILNHDRMLQTYPGADGIKTGYIETSGHNLITSAVHDDVRLVGVLLGAASNLERDLHMTVLLDHGFERLGMLSAPRVAASHFPWLAAPAQAAPLPTFVRPTSHAASVTALPCCSLTRSRLPLLRVHVAPMSTPSASVVACMRQRTRCLSNTVTREKLNQRR